MLSVCKYILYYTYVYMYVLWLNLMFMSLFSFVNEVIKVTCHVIRKSVCIRGREKFRRRQITNVEISFLRVVDAVTADCRVNLYVYIRIINIKYAFQYDNACATEVT